MKIYDVIKKISSEKNISIYKLEHDLNFSNGSISKWNTWSPNAVKLQEVADYLGVTSSFILNEARKDGNK
ncbi:helix-turn-helix transcriptional regulator [uncultured Megamonas sp.]|uniref:helix-turn-helix domain-containing protein n=1 Tax=uncultured Megamonas sp. TaxID=286140 RepID=UPI000BEEB7A2|nr:helix-turn-helix transcriptional regulator [uncultured Megamonas sp.]PEH10058.1 transcriptional regulator [Lactobacillus sp. UMNPBX2]